MTLIADGRIASLITTPATFAAVETVALAAPLPANSLYAGSAIDVVAFGTVSAGSAGTVLARLRIGTAGTTGDTQACATAALGAATAAVGWYLHGRLKVRTIGSGGTCIGNIHLSVAGTVISSLQTATVAINTQLANFLSLTLIGGGTTPVVTITDVTTTAS